MEPLSAGTILLSISMYIIQSFFGGVVQLSFDIIDSKNSFTEVSQIELSDKDNVSEERYLVEQESYASCRIQEVISSSGDTVSLPNEVKDALDCPVIASISPDYRSLAYELDGNVELYNFLTEESRLIAKLSDELDGVSNVFWNTSGTKLAFIEINQVLFPMTTRLVVVDLDEVNTFQTVYDIKIRFSCGSICTTFVGEDIWFTEDDLIEYYTYKVDPYEEITKDSMLQLVL